MASDDDQFGCDVEASPDIVADDRPRAEQGIGLGLRECALLSFGRGRPKLCDERLGVGGCDRPAGHKVGEPGPVYDPILEQLGGSGDDRAGAFGQSALGRQIGRDEGGDLAIGGDSRANTRRYQTSQRSMFCAEVGGDDFARRQQFQIGEAGSHNLKTERYRSCVAARSWAFRKDDNGRSANV